jgi:hypothetical protein
MESDKAEKPLALRPPDHRARQLFDDDAGAVVRCDPRPENRR